MQPAECSSILLLLLLLLTTNNNTTVTNISINTTNPANPRHRPRFVITTPVLRPDRRAPPPKTISMGGGVITRIGFGGYILL